MYSNKKSHRKQTPNYIIKLLYFVAYVNQIDFVNNILKGLRTPNVVFLNRYIPIMLT